MITTTEYPGVLIIRATAAADRAEVETMAGKALQHGAKVSVFAESQRQAGLDLQPPPARW